MRNKLTDKMIHAFLTVSNMEMNTSADFRRAIVRENLSKMIAHSIADKKVIEERGDYQTAFRMELFVLTPEELHQAIQEEALERERFMNLTTMYENINKE